MDKATEIFANDPLLPAAARFAAARPSLGPVALMRRLGIGRKRAGLLLDALDDTRVLIGPGHRAAWRVNPHAWGKLNQKRNADQPQGSNNE
ncbi:TPA: hypothetical protein ACM2VS_005731 [Pseudomonas aeruginosa]|jgi:hypothetical protein